MSVEDNIQSSLYGIIRIFIMAQDLTREEFVRGAVAVVGATVASSVVLADDAHLPKSRRKSALRAQMERRRTIHASDTPRAIKQKLGQYFTPGNIADFMASLFPKATDANVRKAVLM